MIVSWKCRDHRCQTGCTHLLECKLQSSSVDTTCSHLAIHILPGNNAYIVVVDRDMLAVAGVKEGLDCSISGSTRIRYIGMFSTAIKPRLYAPQSNVPTS